MVEEKPTIIPLADYIMNIYEKNKSISLRNIIKPTFSQQ